MMAGSFGPNFTTPPSAASAANARYNGDAHTDGIAAASAARTIQAQELPQKPITNRTMRISLTQFEASFKENNLSLHDFFTKTPKLEGSLTQEEISALIFCSMTRKAENEQYKDPSRAANIGDLAMGVLKNEISNEHRSFDIIDVIAYLYQNLDLAKLADALHKICGDWAKERQALKSLKDACIASTDQLIFPADKDAAWLYDYQMGRIDNEGKPALYPDETETIRIIKMYNMLPSELLARSALRTWKQDFTDMKWLTQGWIDAYIMIEASNLSAPELNLSSKGLIMLPRNIGSLTELKTLNLWGNRLSTLPPEIGQLTRLFELNIGQNQFTNLPLEIAQLPSFGRLYLQNNNFHEGAEEEIRDMFANRRDTVTLQF